MLYSQKAAREYSRGSPSYTLAQVEDWLYGDGESATVQAYNDKLADVDRTIRDACPKSHPSARP